MNKHTFMVGLGAFVSAVSALTLTILSSPAMAAGELVVVVNPESGVTKMSRDEVISIFMGRARKLSTGVTALPIDQMATTSYKASFYRELVNKELAEINSYWARLVFSGQGTPPRQAENIAEVIEIVATNKGAVGYIPREAVTRNLRVVAELGKSI